MGWRNGIERFLQDGNENNLAFLERDWYFRVEEQYPRSRNMYVGVGLPRSGLAGEAPPSSSVESSLRVLPCSQRTQQQHPMAQTRWRPRDWARMGQALNEKPGMKYARINWSRAVLMCKFALWDTHVKTNQLVRYNGIHTISKSYLNLMVFSR